MFVSKKAISPVIAVSLLLVVAVISVVGFSNWFTDFSSIVFSDVELQSSNSAGGSVVISDLIGEILYVVNNGDSQSNISKFLINGVECELGELKNGMNEIDISYCIETISSGAVDLVLVAGTDVIEKEIYLDSNFISSAYFGPSDVFVSVWDTRLNSSGSSNKSQISLPLSGSTSEHIFNISWGDGTNGTISNTNTALHDYGAAGVYQIEISGLLRGFRFDAGKDRNKILDVKQWGDLNVGNSDGYFYGCNNLDISARDGLNLSGTINLENMFGGTALTNVDFSQWDFGEVINMDNMFYNTNNFNSDLGNWDVSKVTSMDSMFRQSKIVDSNLGSWDVSNVITFELMFFKAGKFSGDLSRWNTSNIQYMGWMFQWAGNFNSNISSWDTHNVTSMIYMFTNGNLFNSDLSSWNVSKVTNCEKFNSYSGSAWVLPIPNFTNCEINP